MRKRISLLIAALMLALTMSFASVAFAAPITCPEGQTVKKTSPGTFECVNKAERGNPATEETKNPND